jgi:hypothetical protein
LTTAGFIYGCACRCALVQAKHSIDQKIAVARWNAIAKQWEEEKGTAASSIDADEEE